jgi:hypothetical protein
MMKLLTLATYQRMMAAIEWVERQLQDKHGAGFRPRHEPGGPAFLKTTGDYVGDGLYDARRLNHNLEEMDPPVEVLVRNIMEQGQALPGESSQRHGIVAGTILFGWPGGILHDRVIYNVQWDVSAVRDLRFNPINTSIEVSRITDPGEDDWTPKHQAIICEDL